MKIIAYHWQYVMWVSHKLVDCEQSGTVSSYKYKLVDAVRVFSSILQ